MRARRIGFVQDAVGAGFVLSALLLALVVAWIVLEELGIRTPVAPGRLRHLATVLAVAIPLQAGLAGLAAYLVRRMGAFEAALDADRRIGLADRFASALALAGSSDDPMVAALLEDAERATADLEPARLHPLPRAARLRALQAIGLVAAALLLVRLPGVAPPDEPSAGPEDAPGDRGRSSPPGRRSAAADVAGPGVAEAPEGEEAAETEAEAESASEGGGEGNEPESGGAGGEGDPAAGQPEPEDGGEDEELTNPGETPGDQLFGDEERLEAPRERIDLPSILGDGEAVTREALVRETTPGEDGVPGPGKRPLTPELHLEFERAAEAEIRSPRRTESDRDLVRRYFERIKPR